LAAAILLAVPCYGWAECTAKQLAPGWLWHYAGTIGESDRIRLTFTRTGDAVSGVYFHASDLRDVRVNGKISRDTGLVLDEAAGHFEAEFAEHDPRGKFPGPLRCQIIAGWWRKNGSAQKLPVYLSLESGSAGTLAHLYQIAGAKDDELIHRNAFRFQKALGAGDKATVAAMIEYPIRAHVAGTAKTFHSAQELLTQYDAIFTPAYKKAIAEALPRNMFVNDRGIMMGSGAVWFGADGRVITLNN
jgi:hypothetical protein